MHTYTCPACTGTFDTQHTLTAHLGATLDCPVCGALLIVVPEPAKRHHRIEKAKS